MIGNISFGISFENGRRRVPIPPAVIKAVYPSKPFDDPAPSIESIVRSPTPRRPERAARDVARSEEHTSELQSRPHLVCRLLLEKKKQSARSFPRQVRHNTIRLTAL